jgi:hypothetical protein
MHLYKVLAIITLLYSFSCDSGKSKKEKTDNSVTVSATEALRKPIANKLTLAQANTLADLPLACMQTEYPNKLGQVLASNNDLKGPKTLHPAFYGCFDWHSAVHGHWSLVYLLKKFPNLDKREEIIKKLKENISKENIEQEVAYFTSKYNKSYERTYGWAWILKLAAELHTWDNPDGDQLEVNLKPLTDLIVEKYIEFLPKLVYPIRVGEHTNTAFGLCFAYDYAETVNNEQLKELIIKRANDYFLNDQDCPLTWEPSGYDFLSPCLQEVDLMRRVLTKEKFKRWFSNFLPSALDESFFLEVGKVSDREDGKLVHLDGLNFSRAWVIYGLVNQYPEYSYLLATADTHLAYSLPNLINDSYEGGHWLGSFAIYALQQELNEK